MGEKVYVLSYGMATHIYNNGTTGFQTLRKSLLSFDYIAGPVLLELGSGVKHWTLLFVSLLDQTVTYIDPFGADRSKCEDVRLNWKKFCSTRNVLKEKTWIISPDSYSHSKQNDSFSCGVFICNFFEHMINKKREFLVNNFDLAAYRAKITNTLITKNN